MTSMPYWATDASTPSFAPLSRDDQAEVVVIGAGITGLTAAYLLARAGRRVVVLERHTCASADSGHTSAHLTMVTDTRLSELAKRFGRTHAQAVWDAGLSAIATIEQIVAEHRIDARFERIDGYLHTTVHDAEDDTDRLREDEAVARDLGFDVTYQPAVPLVGAPGLRVQWQGRVQPRAYLGALAELVTSAGGRIFEQSEVSAVEDDPRRVEANGHHVGCDVVVIATHNPLAGLASTASAAMFQTKLAPYTTYVVGARVAKGTVPDALWWDTAEPYRYLRLSPGRVDDVVIYGGHDHKTGQVAHTPERHHSLEQDLKQVVPAAAVQYRWSGQVIETPDGLPYIGSMADGQYIATGYAGNGLTFGTVAGTMIADAIEGRTNPWVDLFAPGRKALTRGLWDYVKENADYPYYMIRDRFAGADQRSARAVPPGEGAVIERDGHKVAVYRDPGGALSEKSAVCTHMGCIVTWNAVETTWDCPCHGSRFTPSGAVIAGPAESPLDDVS